MPIRLEVQAGRDVRSVRVQRTEAVLGRARDADVQLGGSGISRKHARVHVVGNSIEVVDLGSRAGVHVRGERVPRALVAAGESFTVCDTRITLLEAAPGNGREPKTLAPPPGAPRKRKGRRIALPAGLKPAATPRRAPKSSHDPRDHVRPDFDDLLYGAMRRTPWYFVSLGLHLILFALLTVVDLGLSPPPPPPESAVVALSDGSAADALDERIDELLVDDALEDLERLVPDESADDAPFEPQPMKVEEDDPFLDDPVPMQDLHASPMGIQDSASTPLGILPTSTAGMPLGASFGKDEAGNANTAAARALKSSPFTRQLLKGLRLRSSHVSVRVLGGEYDQCESVLERLGIEHDVLLPGELDLAAPGPEIRAIFYNCTSKPLTPRALDHLERFVHGGGYLFTTDWGLENVLEQRFSRYVRTLRDRGRVIMTDDETISFEPASEHPLLRGLPDTTQTSRWWLEDSSVLVDIRDARAVEVLIESKELELRHGSGVVAVTFGHGRGRVVHVLGHFFQKEGNLRGTVAMQRILLNFLYQALRRR